MQRGEEEKNGINPHRGERKERRHQEQASATIDATRRIDVREKEEIEREKEGTAGRGPRIVVGADEKETNSICVFMKEISWDTPVGEEKGKGGVGLDLNDRREKESLMPKGNE